MYVMPEIQITTMQDDKYILFIYKFPGQQTCLKYKIEFSIS